MNGRAGYALLTRVSGVFDAGLAGVAGGDVAIQDLTLWFRLTCVQFTQSFLAKPVAPGR